MSFNISDILKPIGSSILNSLKSDVLANPDIATLSKSFTDAKEIKDRALSAFKATSQPRNGAYFRLPRNTFNDDPKRDAFMMDGAIDPNVIRKRVNPDDAIPSLETGESTLFSLVPENLKSQDYIGLVKSARKNYVNYKNRFFIEDQNKPEPITQMGADKGYVAVPTKLYSDAKPSFIQPQLAPGGIIDKYNNDSKPVEITDPDPDPDPAPGIGVSDTTKKPSYVFGSDDYYKKHPQKQATTPQKPAKPIGGSAKRNRDKNFKIENQDWQHMGDKPTNKIRNRSNRHY